LDKQRVGKSSQHEGSKETKNNDSNDDHLSFTFYHHSYLMYAARRRKNEQTSKRASNSEKKQTIAKHVSSLSATRSCEGLAMASKDRSTSPIQALPAKPITAPGGLKKGWVGCLVAWLPGWLVGWLVGCLPGWLVGWLVGCFWWRQCLFLRHWSLGG
jgi:hypothetical protein